MNPSAYTLLELRQKQAHSETWLAQLDGHPEPVIAKILSLAQLENWQDYTAIEREAQALQKLNHPRIPKLLGFFAEPEHQRVVLLQSHIQGESLRKRIEDRWGCLEVQARQIARDILDILSVLHGQDPPLIHRDIQPEHILLDADHRPYLIDFGSVHLWDPQRYTVAGSFGYMAPEQLNGTALPCSDLYALGMSLIELLSGSPLEELPRQGLYLDLEQALNVSDGFKRWLAHLSAPYPAQRFSSAQEALASLDAPEHLPQLKTLTSLKPSHGKIELSPYIWMKENPNEFTFEIKHEKLTWQQTRLALQTGLIWAAWSGLFFFGLIWTLDLWMYQGDAEIIAVLATGCITPLFAFGVVKITLGTLAKEHQFKIADGLLHHRFMVFRRRQFREQLIHYPLDEIHSLKLSKSQIKLSFNNRRPWLFTLSVPIPEKAQKDLRAALQRHGISSP